MQQPIIIIGMHRSGTTMLTKHLKELGVFIGQSTEVNSEALFFYRLNRWMLRKTNASWDNPNNFEFIDDYFEENVLRILKKQLTSYRVHQYLGKQLAWKYKADLFKLDFVWGWKDPLNSVTLDIWLKLFPKAKVLHIYRHPVDVALSLQTRELKFQKKWSENHLKDKKNRSRLEKDFPTHSFRVKDVEEGVNLWTHYVSKSLGHRNLGEQYFEVCYEDYLKEPLVYLPKVLDFLELDSNNEEKLKSITDKVNPSRSYAYSNKPEMVEFYNSIKKQPLIEELYGSKIDK